MRKVKFHKAIVCFEKKMIKINFHNIINKDKQNRGGGYQNGWFTNQNMQNLEKSGLSNKDILKHRKRKKT